MSKLTEEEFQEWLLNPVTQALKQVLRVWVDEAKVRWAAGEFLGTDQFPTIIANAKAVGNCEACENILTLEYNQLVQELEDASQQ